MKPDLTDRQRETLDILIEAALHGEPCPSREIGEAMGISSEPARVYTFACVSKACVWWETLGPEFDGRIVESLDGSGVTEIVVTRVKS